MWKASPNISWLLILGTATCVATAFDLLGLGNTVVVDLKAEFSAATTPVIQAAAALLDSLCGPVANILIDEDKAPDMSKLKLVYRGISPTQNFDFYLTTAAELIPQLVSCFSCNSTMIVFQHGFTDDPSKQSFVGLNTALQSIGQCNVFAMDASYLLSTGDYLSSATRYVPFIGYAMGDVLAALYEKCQGSINFHLIGHSLGAHICGFAGKTFNNKTGTPIGRITGLDPAGPCYGHIPNDTKLAPTDAGFVDVIHTDKGVFGIDELLGDVDIFPNEGEQQPGCATNNCSHIRSVTYKAESMLGPISNKFIAVACETDEDFRKGTCNRSDTIEMGYFCPPTARGKYYLQTNAESPYGRGDDGTTYVDNGLIISNLVDGLGL